MLGAEQHGAFRHRDGHLAEFAQQRSDARAMKLFAAIDAADDRHDLAPQATDVGRLFDAAAAQPVLQAQQVPQLHGGVGSERERENQSDAAGRQPDQ